MIKASKSNITTVDLGQSNYLNDLDMIVEDHFIKGMGRINTEMIEKNKSKNQSQEICRMILITVSTPKNERTENKKEFIEESIEKLYSLYLCRQNRKQYQE